MTPGEANVAQDADKYHYPSVSVAALSNVRTLRLGTLMSRTPVNKIYHRSMVSPTYASCTVGTAGTRDDPIEPQMPSMFLARS